MKRKIVILVGIMTLVIGSGVGYFFYEKSTEPSLPPPELPRLSQDQLQKSLQDMVTKKVQLRSLQVQMAVFDEVLKLSPNNVIAKQKKAELQSQIDALK